MSTEGASASSSSLDNSEKVEAVSKASELLAQGKKNMVCGEIPKAVNLYEEAVQLLVKSCGELSKDCAEAYFSCGSALLELGRMETSVLGAALDGVEVEEEKEEEANDQFEKPPEDEGEERQKLRDEVYEAMAVGEREHEFEKGVLGKGQKCEIDSACEKLEGKEQDRHVPPAGDANSGLGTVSGEAVQQAKDDACEAKETPTGGGNIKEKQDDSGSPLKDDSGSPLKDDSGSTLKDDSGSTLKDDSGSTLKDDSGSTLKDDSGSGDHVKQAQVESMNVKVSEEHPQGAQDTPKLSDCGDEMPSKEESAGGDKKDVPATEQVTETKINSSEEGKPEVQCEDTEMTDKDAQDEAEEDAGEDEDNTAEDNTTEDKDVQEGEEIDGEDKDEDVPNFQLSWEYLDLAKVIYLKSDSADDQLKAAECYIKLGELSMETEQHATAAEDIESALKIQQKLLAADDRMIAETHYQLGLAYSLGKEFPLSIQHYTQAIDVIEAKIVSLNKLVSQAATEEDNKENVGSAQVQKYEDEIKELQELVPEMRNKIEDAQEEAKDMDKMKQIAKEALGFAGFSKKCESPTKRTERNAGDRLAQVDENGEKKATDIAHLVRKKRKPDDETHAPSDQDLKKLRHDDSSVAAQEVTVNGSTEEGTGNNTSEPMTAEQTPS